jgi:hypothetical protein
MIRRETLNFWERLSLTQIASSLSKSLKASGRPPPGRDFLFLPLADEFLN